MTRPMNDGCNRTFMANAVLGNTWVSTQKKQFEKIAGQQWVNTNSPVWKTVTYPGPTPYATTGSPCKWSWVRNIMRRSA